MAGYSLIVCISLKRCTYIRALRRHHDRMKYKQTGKENEGVRSSLEFPNTEQTPAGIYSVLLYLVRRT